MNYSKISVRYSKALYDLASEKKILDAVYTDILLIEKILQNQDFIGLIQSPVVKKVNKVKAVYSVFDKQINQTTISFLNLILDNCREKNIFDIIRNFKDRYKQSEKIKSVFFTTVIELSEEIKQKISTVVKEYLNSEIDINYNTKKELIGGFILRVDDKQIDTSISSKLKQLKRNLINTTFDYKLPN